MLALKLTLVPVFLLIVSMSGKWWGPSIAGWLAGLPVVAGPILYLLVLAHGPVFGAHAATRHDYQACRANFDTLRAVLHPAANA